MFRARWFSVLALAISGTTLSLAAATLAASPVATTPAPVLPMIINGLTIDSGGRLYGADCFGSRVFRFEPNGPVVVAGGGLAGPPTGDGGAAVDAGLDCPFGPLVDDRGVFILDHGRDSIRLVDMAGIISTFVGPGPFQSPIGMAFDATGDIYVGDRDAQMVRKVDRAGVVTTIAGTGQYGFSGDGGPAMAAELHSPEAIAVDANGDVFFVDADNDRVRRIDATGTITTVAGNGIAASTGDGEPATAASLDNPQEGLVVDASGALFVTESNRIRRIDPDGTITTYAGTGEAGATGDGGPATLAQLQGSGALALGPDGTLYVSSDANGCIRAITPDGLIGSIWCNN